MRSSLFVLMLVFSILALPVASQASWPPAGAPVCIFANDQQFPTTVSDGAGGAIVTWQDQRGSDKDVYAQRLNAAGLPQWTAGGVALCTATGDQWEPKIVSDGASGAIVTWYDNRGGVTADIYAQRVNAAGTVLWTGNGVALCTAADDQVVPAIVSDDAGGAIVTWHDRRSGTNYDVYAQRVDAAGVVQWGTNGAAVSIAVNNQITPTIAADGAGGAIVTWEDGRAGNSDIYTQRMNVSGVPQWTANGVGLCTNTSGQITPTIVSDGASGAIVTWQDGRSGARGIYAQRVSNLGAPTWTVDGVALKTASTNEASSPVIISDGAAGAIVTWYDFRSGTSYDIYARRVSSLGAPQWTANGVAICTATGDQTFPMIVADGSGGAVVTWNDARNVNADIYTQRVNTSGVVQWASNGVVLATGGSDKVFPTGFADGTGGAIVAWYDWRNGATSDIYAQHINGSGTTPTAVSGPSRGPSLLASEVYPNPFSATAWMNIDLAAPSAVRIDIFDVAGRKVRAMTLNNVTSQRVAFDGRDSANRLLPSGVYFYRVKAAGETITRKMVIAR